MYGESGGSAYKHGYLIGSNDSSFSSPTTIAEITAPSGTNTHNVYVFPINNTTAYQYYRLTSDTAVYYTPNTNCVTMWTVQFYGRHEAQTDIIVTAHGGDTVYYMENGSPVTLTTADRDTGIGTVDWSDLPKGAITLYSSTAKNPSDLTADYSKTVYVTEYTTQIYLMPENTLYWWGYEGADLEDCSTANGWGNLASRSWVAPTHNTTDIAFQSQSGSTNAGVGTKNPITFTKLNAIMKSTTGFSSYGLGTQVNTSKFNGGSAIANTDQSVQNTVQLITDTVTEGSYYGAIVATNGRCGNLYALWYE